MPPETLLKTLLVRLPFEPPIINLTSLGDVSYAVTIPRITPLAIVWPPTISVDLLVTYSNEHPLVNDKTRRESFIASPGTVYQVASSACVHEVNIGALSVAPSHTMLNNVLSSHNLFIINTPFIPKEWHKLLSIQIDLINFMTYLILFVSVSIWELPPLLYLHILLQIIFQPFPTPLMYYLTFITNFIIVVIPVLFCAHI
jgi:hypothetical protein